MDIERIREYCLNKPGTSESLPFDDTTLVFKVISKMYCLLNMELPFSINLKCLPEKAIELREQFEEVQPGYHMNKKHWNTILLDGNLRDNQITEWIDDSYNLVAAGLTKKEKVELAKQKNK
ncbi:MAG: MmcQ/YjbR family DNA-binding protein [Chlorobi bacterium]|nr:MmcQ/YjbR family DNA-binding protein [Chlorobiota bacterium]